MLPDPLILGIDTSSSNCSVALTQGPIILASAIEHMNRGQAERLFPLIQETLTRAAKCWQDLNAIGVGTGPGNFTGIRLGVSAARGLSLSLGIPSVGVTMFEALAYEIDGPVLTSINARQGSVYFELHNDPSHSAPVISLTTSVPEEIRAENPLCIGHEAKSIAREIGTIWQEASRSVPVAIAMIAATRYRHSEPRPAPFYVRDANAAPPRDAPPEILR